MSFEKFYFYQHNIRLVRLHKSAEFTTFARISVIFCCDGCRHLLIYHDQTIPTLIHRVNLILSISPTSCTFFFINNISTDISVFLCSMVRSFQCREKNGNLLPHFFTAVKLFFFQVHIFFILFNVFYFRYPLCVHIGNVLGLDL